MALRTGRSSRHADRPYSPTSSSATARLRGGVPDDSCWVEAVRDGWLFLLAAGNGDAFMISVGLPLRDMLEQSRLVAGQIDSPGDTLAEFPSYPRILTDLTGPDWLACGSAAMSFDPVCGEGAGNAAREAILASAVLAAIHQGQEPQAVLAHYRSRLLGGFLRHLEISLDFYTQARQGPWWDSEIAHLQRGIEWTRAKMREVPAPRYRLVDFHLQPL